MQRQLLMRVYSALALSRPLPVSAVLVSAVLSIAMTPSVSLPPLCVCRVTQCVYGVRLCVWRDSTSAPSIDTDLCHIVCVCVCVCVWQRVLSVWHRLLSQT